MPVRRNRIRTAPATRATPIAAAGLLALALLLTACGENDPRSDADAAGPGRSGSTGTTGNPGPDSPVTPTDAVVPAESGNPAPPRSDVPVPSLPPGVPVPPKQPLTPDDRLRLVREAATRAADAWEQAQATQSGPAFVPVSGTVDQVGTWEPQNGAYKASLTNACLDMGRGATVPPHPAEAEVRRADGTVFKRPFLGPDQAFARHVPPSVRAECGKHPYPPFLRVTGITLTTGTVVTTDGPATVPMWEMTFEGTAVRGRAAALLSDPKPPRNVTPDGNISGPPLDYPGSQAAVSPDGRTITLTFVGAPDQPGPCGEDYTVESVQRVGVVALALVRHPRPEPGVMCTAIGASRTASVTLDAPLGSRALIGVQGGFIGRG